MSYPAGWTITPATRQWIYGNGMPPPVGSTDVYTSPDGGLTMEAYSQPLPEGMSPAAWFADYRQVMYVDRDDRSAAAHFVAAVSGS